MRTKPRGVSFGQRHNGTENWRVTPELIARDRALEAAKAERGRIASKIRYAATSSANRAQRDALKARIDAIKAARLCVSCLEPLGKARKEVTRCIPCRKERRR